jgi:acetate kinase
MNSTPTQVACNATPSVLVINSGSSSLKFALVTPESGAIVVSGVAERLNSPEAVVEIKTPKEGKGVS